MIVREEVQIVTVTMTGRVNKWRGKRGEPGLRAVQCSAVPLSVLY